MLMYNRYVSRPLDLPLRHCTIDFPSTRELRTALGDETRLELTSIAAKRPIEPGDDGFERGREKDMERGEGDAEAGHLPSAARTRRGRLEIDPTMARNRTRTT